MWCRRLSLGGFVLGVLLGACLLNATPDHQGALTQLAAYSATPLLLLLSPVLFLLSSVGLYAGHVAGLAGSAVLTWTMVGFATGFVVDRRR
ncbi:MAG: hypothetical protein HYV14_11545 [Elusimicrobia bacterium]|nr:hypothetical protein [Elusimicrobiota bacterium]